MVRRWFSWLLSCSLFVIVGCEDDGPECLLDSDCPVLEICLTGVCQTPSDPNAPGDGGIGDGQVPADGSSPDGALDADVIGVGAVVVYNRPDDGTYTAQAGFSLASSVPDCDVQIDGPCTTITCDVRPPTMDAGMPTDAGAEPDAGMESDAAVNEVDGGDESDAGEAEDAGMPAPPHAGTITITGGAEEVTLEPIVETGVYTAESGSEPLWVSPQTTLTIEAEGAIVPSFTFELPAVASVVLTTPVRPDADPLELDTTAALDLEWEPDEGLTALPDGELIVQVAITDMTMSTSALLVCRFDATSGSGTVPASALAALPSDGTGGLTARMERAVEEIVGEWSLSARSHSPVYDGDGAEIDFPVTIGAGDAM